MAKKKSKILVYIIKGGDFSDITIRFIKNILVYDKYEFIEIAEEELLNKDTKDSIVLTTTNQCFTLCDFSIDSKHLFKNFVFNNLKKFNIPYPPVYFGTIDGIGIRVFTIEERLNSNFSYNSKDNFKIAIRAKQSSNSLGNMIIDNDKLKLFEDFIISNGDKGITSRTLEENGFFVENLSNESCNKLLESLNYRKYYYQRVLENIENEYRIYWHHGMDENELDKVISNLYMVRRHGYSLVQDKSNVSTNIIPSNEVIEIFKNNHELRKLLHNLIVLFKTNKLLCASADIFTLKKDKNKNSITCGCFEYSNEFSMRKSGNKETILKFYNGIEKALLKTIKNKFNICNTN